MATDRKVRAELLRRLRSSKQALSQRVSRIKKEHGPMSTEEAVYIIAHEKGIDLSKYLDKSTVDKVRTLIPHRGNAVGPQLKIRKAGEKIVYIKINTEIPQVDALLSTAIAEDAKKMAKLYLLHYILENSIRVVIKRVLENRYGDNWWESKVSKPIRDDVKKRILKENTEPWHGKRGPHEIFYSDFGDLKSIISKNWEDFKALFPSQPWIFQRLNELEHPRNVIAHNNPLSKDDETRIKLYFSDWVKLLAEKKHLILESS
jgi:hypothetical protein